MRIWPDLESRVLATYRKLNLDIYKAGRLQGEHVAVHQLHTQHTLPSNCPKVCENATAMTKTASYRSDDLALDAGSPIPSIRLELAGRRLMSHRKVSQGQ